MVIKHNIMAINVHKNFMANAALQAKCIERLSTGLRINRASDDAAGLSISEKMRSQIRGLNQASRNAQDSISMIQSAEGALDEVHDMLQRANELAIQAANDTYTDKDRAAINQEYRQLMNEIDRIGSQTEFNNIKLFSGSANNFKVQSGANKGDTIGIDNREMNTDKLGLKDYDLTTRENAEKAISAIQNAVGKISDQRSAYGAKQNRLEHTIKNLENQSENLQAAESRIRDADIAKEMMRYTKLNILMQLGQFLMAQANQQPQSILNLLK